MGSRVENGAVSRHAPRWLRVVLTGIVFLAPLKFGLTVGMTEVGIFPVSVWDWLLSAWPLALFPVLTGGALLFAAAVYAPPAISLRRCAVPGIWWLLVVAALAGLIRTTELDFAWQMLWTLLGVCCYASAVWWVLPHDPALPRLLVGALAAGVVICCLSGWEQSVFGGMEATAAFAEEAARAQGRTLPEGVVIRLAEKRAFGPFVYPNSLAAHLILCGPLVLLLAWRSAGSFQPVRLSRMLFLLVAGVLLGGTLWLTGSRAALLALAGGLALAIMFQPGFRRWRLPAIVMCLVAATATIAMLSRGRDLASLSSRLDYYAAAVRMYATHPGTGVGLGEFYPHYMRLKPPGAEETRLPHNMLLNFASQTGTLGALAALACLTVPVALLLPLRRQRRNADGTDPAAGGGFCIVAGLTAWGLHAMADFNVQIPGTLLVFAMLPLPWLRAGEPQGAADPAGSRRRPALRLGAVAAALLCLAGGWRWRGERAYHALHAQSATPSTSLQLLVEQTVATARLLPHSPYPWLVLGRAAEEARFPELAASAFTTAAERAPHRAAFHAAVARNALLFDDLELAEHALRRALEWYPHSPRHAGLETMLLERRRAAHPASPEDAQNL